MNLKLNLEDKMIYPGVINLTQFTSGTDTLVFLMPDYVYQTTDLSQMNCYAVCDMPITEEDYRINEVKLHSEIIDDILQIKWDISGYTTAKAGTITYQIVFKNKENTQTKLWSSDRAIIFINSSVNTDGMLAAMYPDIFMQWEDRMIQTDKDSKANLDETIKHAVLTEEAVKETQEQVKKATEQANHSQQQAERSQVQADKAEQIESNIEKLVGYEPVDAIGQEVMQARGTYSLLNERLDTIEDVSYNHFTDKLNPHAVTKSQIGLGNVDNTKDLDKPISTATQNSLNAKAEKTTVYTKGEINSQLETKAPVTHTHSRNEIIDYTINLTNEDLNIYHGVDKIGLYSAGGANKCTNKPAGVQGFGLEVIKSADGCYTQILYSSSSDQSEYIRYYNAPVMTKWTEWVKVSKEGHIHDSRYYTEEEIDSKTNKIESSIENLKENGITAGDTLPIGSVVYFDGTEESLSTGYEKVDMIPPRQLLINNDFQCNQRGLSEYISGTAWKYTVDMWRIRNITGITLTVNEDNTLTISNSNQTADAYFQQIHHNYLPDTYTLSVYVTELNGEAYLDEYLKSPINIGENHVTSRGRINAKDILIGIRPNSRITLKYIDLFEGDIVYPHVKEDYAIALLKCLPYIEQREILLVSYNYGITNATFSYEFPIRKVSAPTVEIIAASLAKCTGGVVNINHKDVIQMENIRCRLYYQFAGLSAVMPVYTYVTLLITCEPL